MKARYLGLVHNLVDLIPVAEAQGHELDIDIDSTFKECKVEFYEDGWFARNKKIEFRFNWNKPGLSAARKHVNKIRKFLGLGAIK